MAEMFVSRVGRARPARRILGSITALGLAVPLVAAAVPAGTAAAATPYVRVDGTSITRAADRASVSARITWNADGVSDFAMTRGDLRLVAVSERGHLPYLLGTVSQDVSRDRTRSVTIVVTEPRALAAMRTGNRIVLTASQHQDPGQVTRSDRTYVTVAEVQPFGSPQPRVGTTDCSATAILPGAMLRYCDLVGADLDGALVSVHDPESQEGTVPSRSTRLERADLTGATAIRSDFSGASIAGGRLNGIDLTRAKLDNLSLAGAEAIEIVARAATSDKDARDSGADFFRTNLTGADFRDTVFRGVSVARSRLDGADLRGATWESYGNGATFRGADLTGALLGASLVDFVDFTDATLTASTLTDLQLAWAYLCRTALPAGSTLDASRDCRGPVERSRTPIPAPEQADPYVRISDDALDGGPGSLAVSARVDWDEGAADPAGYGMTRGTLRLVAVDARSGVPTLLDAQAVDDVTTPASYTVTITDRAKLAAMGRGNRIVLTATQHPPRARAGKVTTRTYVTVDVLQRGPALGRIGTLDCSRVALTADSARALDFCDLSGAMLDTAALNGRSMREVDLAGATMHNARIGGLFLDGSRLAGVDADGSRWSNISAFDSWAPRLDLSGGTVVGSPLYPRNLDGAVFDGSTLTDSPLTAASLRRATFAKARLIHPDLAYADLSEARMTGVDASLSNPSLFLADLTRADLSGSTWNVDETGDNPWRWATLCSSLLPSQDFGVSGDRDCPR
jgi:uncharacterized protein YjbI with pentapeptide repeats